jgi:hypothetical protein
MGVNESDEPQVAEVECDQCHLVKPCTLTPDPYKAEIHPEDENPEEGWCADCYHSACDDI